MKKKLSVSFSGGRTSAYMAKWLKDNKSDEYEFSFIFANTGQEHEKTLEFVNECDKRWGFNVVWLECVVDPEPHKGTGWKVVTYETASRNGEPFEQVCAKYGLSNPTFKPCNREMKTVPMDKYRREVIGDCEIAIGIRADEIDRMSVKAKEKGLVYPLISWHPTTKAEIRHWWKEQDFDLEIPEHMGNCVTCWQKSFRKLMTIAKHEPERFDFFRRMEQEHGMSGAPSEDGKPRKWYRNYTSVDEIIARSREPFNEFVDHMPELQLRLFCDQITEIDELDKNYGSCTGSCEAFGADE